MCHKYFRHIFREIRIFTGMKSELAVPYFRFAVDPRLPLLRIIITTI